MGSYLERAGLVLGEAQLVAARLVLRSTLAALPQAGKCDLFRYPVPKLGEGGSCSLIDELEPESWDIAPMLGGESDALAVVLSQAQQLLDAVLQHLPADWLGVYCRLPSKEHDVLLKIAYRGLPSRAEFPLTDAFALTSNNSKVGCSGLAVLIDDVRRWQRDGGAYYECDPKVRSEVCLPVFDGDGQVIGILDAESFVVGFFDEEGQALLAALAGELTPLFLALRAGVK